MSEDGEISFDSPDTGRTDLASERSVNIPRHKKKNYYNPISHILTYHVPTVAAMYSIFVLLLNIVSVCCIPV